MNAGQPPYASLLNENIEELKKRMEELPRHNDEYKLLVEAVVELEKANLLISTYNRLTLMLGANRTDKL